MKAIHKKRLLNVAKALRDERAWRKKNPPRGPEDRFTMEKVVNVCGSPGCAAGTYASRRDLQRTFRIVKDENTAWVEDERGESSWSGILWSLRDHFGLSTHEADELFQEMGCDNAQTEIQAARYIERFVARKEREAAR